MSCTYRFMNSSLSQLSTDRDYDVILRQQPNRAKISVPNERDKRSIEPPPILQLQWINCTVEEEKKSLQSPFYFMVVNIVHANTDDNMILSTQDYLSGSTVSSLYRLRDIDNTDGGFFVFGDLAVKKQGHFKLQFSLFELIDGKVENRKTIYSNDFIVYTAKQYPGPIESTFLSRTFSDQGIKMRVRKEHRVQQQQNNNGQNQKSRTNIRKRKYDIPSDTSSSSCSNSNQYNRIIPKEILSPSYASDNVHFGRWQSMTHKSKRSHTSTSSSSSSSSSLPPSNNMNSSQPPPPLPLPSPPPSISSSSPMLLYLPPIISSAPPLLPPPHIFSLNEHQKWMMLDYDSYHNNILPPLREIMNNKHAGDSYSPFPIDNSFFNRHH